MRQRGILSSGCHQYTKHVASINGNRFALATSLAVYLYSDGFQIEGVFAHHQKHLNAISWNPRENSLLACSSDDKEVKIYHVDLEAVQYSVRYNLDSPVNQIIWPSQDPDILLLLVGRALVSWDYKQGKWQVLHTCKADITCMAENSSQPRYVALGCADGAVLIFDLHTSKIAMTIRPQQEAVPCDVQFDPLSKNYLLVICRNGVMALYDITDGKEVSAFSKQPAAERSAVFLPWAPGTFLTVSNKSSVIQQWNVSQSQPIRLLKTGHVAGARAIHLYGNKLGLVTFMDGLVMVYNIEKQVAVWQSERGHTETVFDCQFSRHDPNLLATCSYDMTVRVWDMATRNCIKVLTGSTQTLYSVAWSPSGQSLVAASVSGHIYFYDYKRGQAIKTWPLHTQTSLKVCWHPKDPHLIASTSLDGTLVLFDTSAGHTLSQLHVGSSARGCAWSPVQQHLLAVATDVGSVLVYSTCKLEEPQLIQELTGHSSRVFGVNWSPLLPNLLISSSDDNTARVWDIGGCPPAVQNQSPSPIGYCRAILQGHHQQVRSLCWHPEIPHMAITGSWDATIRVWDVTTGHCVHMATDHYSDVYGLSMHPDRPFVMASCSRDSTIRLWDMMPLTPGVLMKAIFDEVQWGDAEEVFKAYCALEGTDPIHLQPPVPVLCGSGSKRVLSKLQGLVAADGQAPSGPLSLSACALWFNFFCAPGHVHALWELADMMQPGTEARVIPNSSIQHYKATRMWLTSQAHQLELSADKSKRGVAAGASSKEEQLRKAALLHLQAGDVEQCCEVLVRLQDWPLALAFAPAVSQSYWKKLMTKKIECDEKAGASWDVLVPEYLVTGQSGALTDLLLAQHQYDLAASISAVQSQSGYPQHTNPVRSASTSLKGAPIRLAGISDGGTGHCGQLPSTVCPVGSNKDQAGQDKNIYRNTSLPPPQSTAAEAIHDALQATSLGHHKVPPAGNGSEDQLALAQLKMIRQSQGRQYHKQGQPVLSACCYLSVGDVREAVQQLYLGGEWAMAGALAMALEVPMEEDMVVNLARKCEQQGDVCTAMRVLHYLQEPERVALHLELTAIRGGQHLNDAQVQALHGQLGLQYRGKDEASEPNTDVSQLIRHLLLSGQHQEAGVKLLAALYLHLGNMAKFVTADGSSSPPMEDLRDLVYSLNCICMDRMPRQLNVELFAYVLYLAAHQAFQRGYHLVGRYLMASTRRWINMKALQFPVSEDLMTLQEADYLTPSQPEVAGQLLTSILDQNNTQGNLAEAARSRLKSLPSLSPGLRKDGCQVVVEGAMLPCRSLGGGARRSSLSGMVVRGPGVWLEDGITWASLNEAVMLSQVMWLSPGGTGQGMKILV